MKTILNSIFALLCVSHLVFADIATGPTFAVVNFPASLPIQDRGTLRTFAMEQIAWGYESLGATLVPNSSSVTYGEVHESNPIALTTKLSQLSFHFSLASSSDRVYAYSDVFNADGDVLFWGGTEVSYQKAANGDYLLSPASSIQYQMAYWIPIPAPGVVSAEIIYRDEQGNVYEELQLNVFNGKIAFPTETTEKGGQVILSGYNAQGVFVSQLYGLDGKQQSALNVLGSVRVGFPNYKFADEKTLLPGDQLNVALVAQRFSPQTGQTLEPPVIEVTLAFSRVVNVMCTYIPVKIGTVTQSKHVFLRQKGQKTVTPFNITPGSATSVSLPPGTWYFTFDFDDFKDTVLPPIDNGGGKG